MLRHFCSSKINCWIFVGVYAKVLLHFCAAVKVLAAARKDAKMLRHFCSSKINCWISRVGVYAKVLLHFCAAVKVFATARESTQNRYCDFAPAN